jgi:gas vesicle protein
MDDDRGSGGLAILGAFILGGLVGAGIALLTAPKSGRDTREHVSRWASEKYGKAGEKLSQVGERVRDKVREKLHQAEEQV